MAAGLADLRMAQVYTARILATDYPGTGATVSNSGIDFDSLSSRDLLEARDVYHAHLMNHPHVQATAIGRYRIRTEEAWPSRKGACDRDLGNPRE